MDIEAGDDDAEERDKKFEKAAEKMGIRFHGTHERMKEGSDSEDEDDQEEHKGDFNLKDDKIIETGSIGARSHDNEH